MSEPARADFFEALDIWTGPFVAAGLTQDSIVARKREAGKPRLRPHYT